MKAKVRTGTGRKPPTGRSKRALRVQDLDIPEMTAPDLSGFSDYKSSLDFSTPWKVQGMLVKQFLAGDLSTFLDILRLYLDRVGKTWFSKETKIPQRTIYNLLKKDHVPSAERVFGVMKHLSKQAGRTP